MATEYKLSYTASEIDEKLGQIAKNVEARHEHYNEETLDLFESFNAGEDYVMPFFDGHPILTNSHGGVITNIAQNHITGETTIKYRRYADFTKPIEEYVITTPTKTSQIENDSGFIDKDALSEATHAHGNKSTLDKLGEEDDYLTYNGVKLATVSDNPDTGLDGDLGLNSTSVTIDPTLTMPDAAAEAKATGDRLTDIEYQTVTTDLAYEHKDLPTGEKTVTVSGDGTFGNNAYVISGEDMIPRKTFNRNFPYNGITITRNDKTYHIEGTTTASGSVNFAETLTNGWIDISKDVSGKSFKLITFVDKAIGSSLISSVQFFDADKKVVNVTDKNGTSKSRISEYFAGDTLYKASNFSIPEGVNIAYMQANIEFYTNKVLDHDFQFYVVEDDNTQTVTLENPTAAITDESVTNVFSAPYQSVAEIEAPINEYIKYMTANAKGDTATYLTPEAFGAIGDGYADDINAITACLAMANATNQTVLMAQKYLISAPIDINGNDFNININDIVYSGTDTAVKIHGQRNTVNIHSITSSGVGVKFLGDNEKYSEWTLYNNLEVNSITAASHGIVFAIENAASASYQNTVRFNYIQAGGTGCYGIAYFNSTDSGSFGEDNFYGGLITNCEWACYGIRGNSKFYGIQVEGNVQGGFYIFGHVQIFHPRITESQRDGSLPIYKFIKTHYTTIYDSTGISINQIDLSEAEDTETNDFPLSEGKISKINGAIYARIPATGEDTIGVVYCRDAYVWGKYLIMQPHMAYRKEVTTEILDTRLIGTEGADEDSKIRSLSQLPTKFVVNTINTEIYLHSSYCAFGFNEFEVEQANGFTCKIYDCKDNLIFDGTEQGDGLYKLNVYKDATYSAEHNWGRLPIDFTGHYWQVTKESISATDDGQGNVTLTTGAISI